MPRFFDEVVSGVRKMAGFDETSQSYEKPSVALQLGHLLRKAALVLKGIAAREENSALLTQTELFF